MTQPPQDPWQQGHGRQQPPGPAGSPPPTRSQPLPQQQRPGPPGGGGYADAGRQPGRHWAQSAPGYGYPPPKKSGAPIIAACLSLAALLVVGVIVTVSLVGDDADVADAGYRAPPGATGAAESSETSTRSPSASSPTGSSSPSSSRRSTSQSTPQGPQKVLKLADHPLLQDAAGGLQNQACKLPTWQSNQATAEAFFTAAGQCLNAAWGPYLEAYDLPFTPPALHFPTGSSFQTDCGTIQVGIATAAYYCENNLYVPFAGLQTDQYGNNPGVYLSLFAHEYGHHVQEVAGLMDAAWEAIYQVGPDSEPGLEMARRKELQAQCFSGMFMGAHVDRGGTIDREMYGKAWDDQETRGDNTSGSRDHGTNVHYAQWWRAGAKENRIVDCNTFAASGADVS